MTTTETPMNNNQIIAKYNEIKQKYTVYFQKAIELEDELREHNLVANTLSTADDKKRCWRMIEGVLVEKNVEQIKKELDTQIMNIKQTLDVVQKTMRSQEAIMKEWEKKYSSVLGQQKQSKPEENKTNTSKGGVLA
eukprot:CAMPEP_0170514574 /NCGR_PEP_ID=MMETSP0209-20121228/1162_1 /TAXON_ID=665100 ORGANISM="Litonotus pictus, Strain P1" /NCGR_SAMPLE_ID=MMETSP0209 /ASSEMBLY_ACC=CAM_ASM_000301 /LENGTH=135 /DNA_ID=CAMNT_0010798729 /DNA_START=11 /DNA_END=418 /DNA_ORIENTATION=+